MTAPMTDGFPETISALPGEKIIARDNLAEWARQMCFEAATSLAADIEHEANIAAREAVFDHVDKWLGVLWPTP